LRRFFIGKKAGEVAVVVGGFLVVVVGKPEAYKAIDLDIG